MTTSRANEKDRNDPVLQQEIIDAFKGQTDVIRRAAEKIEEAQTILREAYKFGWRGGDGGPLIFVDRMRVHVSAALGDSDFPLNFYNEQVLKLGSTYIGNAAAFENAEHVEDDDRW